MAARRASIAAAVLVATVTSSAPRACGDTFEWTPAWHAGKYWIVRSPLVRHVIDPDTSRFTEVPDGHYYTRFLVVADDVSHAGRTVTLEVRCRENDEGTFDEVSDRLELTIDMERMRVVSVRLKGIDAGGRRMDHPIPHDRGEPGVFFLGWIPRIPESLPLMLPAFRRSLSAPYTYELADLAHVDADIPGYSYSQSVDVGNGVATVRTWAGEGAEVRSEAVAVPERLVFEPDLPWPHAACGDSSLLAEVVEVGTLD